MSDKKITLYEITEDMKALMDLLNVLEDENGDPREPTPEETETMKAWFDVTTEQFEKKFDSYCKFIKNLRLEAEIADSERKLYKSELDRLSRRSNALENRAKAIQGLLWYAMQNVGFAKSGYKTALFSAKEQNTQKSVDVVSGFDWRKIPERYIKKPEIDKTAIKQDLADGELYQVEGDHFNRLYIKGTDKALKDVYCVQGRTLVIR